MMRLARRTSLLVTLSLLTSAATAHAECAWVLWDGVDTAHRENPTKPYPRHGRRQITQDDFPILARVVVSSMPSECGAVFVALVRHGGEPLRTGQVQNILRVKHGETARKVMEDLDRRGVIELETTGIGMPGEIRFREPWAWCASPEFRGLLTGEPVTNRELCASASPTCQKSGGVCISHLSPIT